MSEEILLVVVERIMPVEAKARNIAGLGSRCFASHPLVVGLEATASAGSQIHKSEGCVLFARKVQNKIVLAGPGLG